MRLSRGELLKLAAGAAGAAAISGCSEVTRRLSVPELPERIGAAEAEPVDPAWRLLNRAAFGPRPGDLERVREIGTDAYLEEQLSPETIDESRAAWMRLLPLDTLNMDASDAQDFEMATYPEVGQGQAAIELQQACVLRAVYSSRQLEQVMVELWTDHFNVSQLKAECSWLKTVDDRQIRKHALGRFRDLVSASAHSAAMLFYLDNDKNHKRDPKTGSGANENYARELLELHTLGVDGGYTLKDIQEVARCFSGWSYKKGFSFWPGDFTFEPQHHDDGPKRVLGVKIPPGQGLKDGEQVIDLVCGHPSTARFIARKLCRRFVSDRPQPRLTARLAEVFTKTDGDLRQVLSELFRSRELQRGPDRKLKRPFDYAVSALRVLNADTQGVGVLPYLERMGQLPYKWTMPDGYPERVDAWTPSLLARWNFALDLLNGKIDGTSVDAPGLARATGKKEPVEVARSLSRLVLGRPLAEPVLKKLAALAEGRKEDAAGPQLAMLLSAPEFQWR
ncbi:MAG: DUF1800 domain-containing protein [Armatimonadota bacterium]